MDIDDRIVRLIAFVEKRSEDPAIHPDDETIALFLDGMLAQPERETVVQHVADCAHCREVMRHLMVTDEELLPIAQTPPKLEEKRLRVRAAWAMAATVLLSVGFLTIQTISNRASERRFYSNASELLAAAEFTEVTTLLEEAERQGIRSDRLLNLQSQAIRKYAGPLALTFDGRLTDFGYDIGGIEPRDPLAQLDRPNLNVAHDLLRVANSPNRELRLNRAHSLLVQGKNEDARAEFEECTRLFPLDPATWLGTGLSRFVTNDFAGAETAFRECLRLQPDNSSARQNLAMTLEEEGNFVEALDNWREVLPAETSPSLRAKIALHVETLESQIKDEHQTK